MRQKSTAIQEQLDADQRQLSQANEDNQSLREKVNEIELNLQTEKNTLRTSMFFIDSLKQMVKDSFICHFFCGSLNFAGTQILQVSFLMFLKIMTKFSDFPDVKVL